MGTSLRVNPVKIIPKSIPRDVPRILINREPLLDHKFDIELLGNCDEITNEICHMLGSDWESVCSSDTRLQQIDQLPPPAHPHFPTPQGSSTRDEHDTEDWHPITENVADRLPEGTYYYNGRKRYVFRGAEVIRRVVQNR